MHADAGSDNLHESTHPCLFRLPLPLLNASRFHPLHPFPPSLPFSPSPFQQVLLYGNPLTEVRERSKSDRASAAAQGRDIVNYVTDAPEDERSRRAAPVRVGPKTQGNLRGSYARYNIAKVDESMGPSNAAWREAGNKLLFHDEDSDSDLEVPAGGIPVGKAGKSKRKQPQGQG